MPDTTTRLDPRIRKCTKMTQRFLRPIILQCTGKLSQFAMHSVRICDVTSQGRGQYEILKYAKTK
jgi:hypothetical protein